MKDKLAPYKYPRQIEFVTELPKTATGKIQRFKLRELERRVTRRDGSSFVEIDWAGTRPRTVRIEHRWDHRTIAAERAAAGLPARRAWARWRCGATSPQRLCAPPAARPGVLAPRLRPQHARGRGGLGPGLHAPPGAREVLPALLRPRRRRARRDRPGCSATATAARSRCCTPPFPGPLAGCRVLAPHIWSRTCRWPASRTRRPPPANHRPQAAAGATTPRRPDSAFFGWNDASGCIRRSAQWSIEDEIASIAARCWRFRGGRRVRHAGTDPRHRARVPQTSCSNCPLRPLAAPGPATGRDRRRRRPSIRSKHQTGTEPMKLKTAFAAALVVASAASGPGASLKVDLMLPATGTYAALGTRHRERLQALRRTASGAASWAPRDRVRQVDDERSRQGHRQRQQADQARQRRRAGRHGALRRGDGDGLRSRRDTGTLLLVPNAGADAVTGPMCAPNIFRSSVQQLAAGLRDGRGGGQEGPQERRHHHLEVRRRRRIGQGASREAFEKAGGKVVKDPTLPFPNVEFRPC